MCYHYHCSEISCCVIYSITGPNWTLLTSHTIPWDIFHDHGHKFPLAQRPPIQEGHVVIAAKGIFMLYGTSKALNYITTKEMARLNWYVPKSYPANAMTADVQVTQSTRVSSAMILPYFSWNSPLLEIKFYSFYSQCECKCIFCIMVARSLIINLNFHKKVHPNNLLNCP